MTQTILYQLLFFFRCQAGLSLFTIDQLLRRYREAPFGCKEEAKNVRFWSFIGVAPDS